MVRAWVALAAGKRAGEVFSSSTMVGNAAAAELDGQHQPAGAGADDDNRAIRFSFTAFPACMLP